jgi:hypothetical protein
LRLSAGEMFLDLFVDASKSSSDRWSILAKWDVCWPFEDGDYSSIFHEKRSKNWAFIAQSAHYTTEPFGALNCSLRDSFAADKFSTFLPTRMTEAVHTSVLNELPYGHAPLVRDLPIEIQQFRTIR